MCRVQQGDITGHSMLTLTQAAKEVGRTRSTIFKSIKSGRLSATKDAQGHLLIDPVELIKIDTLFKVKVISLIFDYLADTGIA